MLLGFFKNTFMNHFLIFSPIFLHGKFIDVKFIDKLDGLCFMTNKIIGFIIEIWILGLLDGGYKDFFFMKFTSFMEVLV